MHNKKKLYQIGSEPVGYSFFLLYSARDRHIMYKKFCVQGWKHEKNYKLDFGMRSDNGMLRGT